MNNIPNPFRRNSELNYTPPSTPVQSSSPGFLAITRPASASSLGHDGRGRSMGRANYRSGFNPRSSSPYLTNNSFHSHQKKLFNANDFQNFSSQSSPGYDNREQQLGSSGKSYFSKRGSSSFSTPPYHQSTPHSFRRGFRKDRGGFHHGTHFGSLGRGSFHKTPLKDIPVDKFISQNMVKDPWEELDSDTDFDPCINTSYVWFHEKTDYNKKVHNIIETSDSIARPYTSSSEKDTGTESDTTVSDST